MSVASYARYLNDARPKSVGVVRQFRECIRGLVLDVVAKFSKGYDDKFLRLIYCHYVFDDQKEEFEKLLVKLMEIGSLSTLIPAWRCWMGRGRSTVGIFICLLMTDSKITIQMHFQFWKKLRVPAIMFVPSSLIGCDFETARKYCTETMGYSGVIELMTLSDLKEMHAAGVEIGSHTKTHARFSEISKDENILRDEIAGSKAELEELLGVECKYISWPFGTKLDADERSLQMTADSGYSACFGAYRGSVMPNKTNRWSIPRHHFEVEWKARHIDYFARGNMENN